MLKWPEGSVLGEIKVGKVIPRNFGKIHHLTGSKMIDNEDVLYDLEGQKKFTEALRRPTDRVIISEKLDGMNAGVLMKNGEIIPINRKGYDVRSNLMLADGKPNWLFYFWALWVNMNAYNLKNSELLTEGGRLVFENCMMKHTLDYKFKVNDPVFLLAAYDAEGKRKSYDELVEYADDDGFNMPPIFNIGSAVPTETILNQYRKGLSGVKGDIEGFVYTYESNGVFESSAKFVSNKKMGTDISFPNKFQKFPRAEQFEVVRYEVCKQFGLDYEGEVK